MNRMPFFSGSRTLFMQSTKETPKIEFLLVAFSIRRLSPGRRDFAPQLYAVIAKSVIRGVAEQSGVSDGTRDSHATQFSVGVEMPAIGMAYSVGASFNL